VFGGAGPRRSQYAQKARLASLNGQGSALLLRSEHARSCDTGPTAPLSRQDHCPARRNLGAGARFLH